jgi:hypothetical protein
VQPAHLEENIDRPVEGFGQIEQPRRRIAADDLHNRAEGGRYRLDEQRAALAPADNRPRLAALLLRKAHEIRRTGDLPHQIEKPAQALGIDGDVVLDDQPGIEVAGDDLAPCLAMAQEAADLAGPEREGIARPVKARAIDRRASTCGRRRSARARWMTKPSMRIARYAPCPAASRR